MKEYLNLFIDYDNPNFLQKYCKTKTLQRLKNVTQFCGCDYTNLYHPKFLYTRFDHSLIVAHMTWHFTHDKQETVAALLHDIGTPCFAHTIDFLLGDSMKQESSEQDIITVIQKDDELIKYLQEDGISLLKLKKLDNFPILENHSPKLCTDRLDGVLHTCYIWLQTHSLEEIKEIYDDIIILQNEEGKKELGFCHLKQALKFANMVKVYAIELQGNRDKYVMNYISEILKKAISENKLQLQDLYQKKEVEIVKLLTQNYPSWQQFNQSSKIISTNLLPNQFYVSIQSKKRNVIPLVKNKKTSKRINHYKQGQKIYQKIDTFQPKKYAYIREISQL